MLRKTFVWDNSGKLPASERWLDHFWIGGLLLAALLLFSLNLGGVPLRDWDEGTVAQVARDLARAPFGSATWLYPTIAGSPYLNKPPLVHWLIALAFKAGGVNEWTARLPGAWLTACSIPLLYGIGREVFPTRTPAVLAALVYLTLLPVARHGRLAMLDGALLCFFLLMLFCLLRTRRDLRWGLGAGIAFGLLCLTKGIVALLLGAIAVTFVLLDTPRLLTSGYVWLGLLLGSAPVAAWYGAQWLHYPQFFQYSLLGQSFNRVWTVVENNDGPPWYYLLEILKYGLPWLVFLPQGFRLAWENRNMGWAKLVLVWVGGYLLVISLMSTKLPWYVLPIYPALALVVGAHLAEVWDLADVLGVQPFPRRRFPRAWMAVFGLVAIVAWSSSFYFSRLGPAPQLELQVILMAVALTMTVATVLVMRHNSQFIAVLFWGLYISLLLLMLSRQWVWELGEAYPVPPVAEIVERYTPPGTIVRTSYPYSRPSLNFYSERQVEPAALPEIKALWQQTPQPYVLINQADFSQLGLQPSRTLGKAEGWLLVTKANSPQPR